MVPILIADKGRGPFGLDLPGLHVHFRGCSISLVLYQPRQWGFRWGRGWGDAYIALHLGRLSLELTWDCLPELGGEASIQAAFDRLWTEQAEAEYRRGARGEDEEGISSHGAQRPRATEGEDAEALEEAGAIDAAQGRLSLEDGGGRVDPAHAESPAGTGPPSKLKGA